MPTTDSDERAGISIVLNLENSMGRFGHWSLKTKFKTVRPKNKASFKYFSVAFWGNLWNLCIFDLFQDTLDHFSPKIFSKNKKLLENLSVQKIGKSKKLLRPETVYKKPVPFAEKVAEKISNFLGLIQILKKLFREFFSIFDLF